MKYHASYLGPALLIVILSCGCERLKNNSESQISLLKSDTANLKDSIRQLHLSIDSIKSYGKVTNFIKAFYGALELSDEENQRQYTEGGVPFDLSNFYSLIRSDATYSRERVDNLSDKNYHDRIYIGLKEINKIDIGFSRITVNTTAVYGLYEVGTFENQEELILIEERGLIRLLIWRDIGVKTMKIAGYEGLENFTQKDFYESIGSVNF